jgi:hypothetical protein
MAESPPEPHYVEIDSRRTSSPCPTPADHRSAQGVMLSHYNLIANIRQL